MTGATVPGVYGMRLLGLHPDPDLLARVGFGAPPLTVERTVCVDQQSPVPVGVRQLVEGAGTMTLRLDERRVEYALNVELSDDELVHPWLAPAAAAMALRDGRLALHGGVFEVDGLGVAVVGDREAGKSTLVAAAAASGVGVLTDDVVVVDDALTIYAGPRCIDLREGSAAFFGSRRTVPARGGRRQRMLLGPVAPVARLAALVVLSWGESLTLSRLAGPRCVDALVPHLASARTPASFAHVLRLANAPLYRLTRPRDLRLLSRTLADVISLATAEQSS